MECLVVSKTNELSRGERKNHKEFAGVLIFLHWMSGIFKGKITNLETPYPHHVLFGFIL